MCEFIPQTYTYVSWSSPLPVSLRNQRRASLDRIEAYADKGNIISSKRERGFLRNFFLICEFISQSYTFVSSSSPLTLTMRKLRMASLDHIEAYADKGNFIRSKRERSFLRNFFLICEFISHSYNLCSKSSLLTLFSWNLQSEIWVPIVAHGEKVNIPR